MQRACGKQERRAVGGNGLKGGEAVMSHNQIIGSQTLAQIADWIFGGNLRRLDSKRFQRLNRARGNVRPRLSAYANKRGLY